MQESCTVFLIDGAFTEPDSSMIRLDGLTQKEFETVLEIVGRQINRIDLVIQKGVETAAAAEVANA